jgi:TPR repeat protein
MMTTYGVDCRRSFVMQDDSSEQVLFSWLHLSDIHVGHGSVPYGWDQHAVLVKLQEDIETSLAPTVGIPKPNAVFITGDVAFSANAKRNPPMARDGEYTGATRWLDEILRRIGLQRKDVYMVPGNHDVQRKVDEDDEDIHRLVDAARSASRPEDSLDALLNREKSRARLEQRLANYFEFATGFAPACARGPDGRARLFWHVDIDPPELRVHKLGLRLVGLNTVLVGGRKKDMGKLWVGREQLTCLNSVKDRLVIALSHHPTDWLADGEHVKQVLRSARAIHLCGHVHNQDTEARRSGAGSELFTVVAGAVHADEEDHEDPVGHGYSFGAILAVEGRLVMRVWPRAWERDNHRFQLHGKGAKTNLLYAEHDLRRLPGTGHEPEPGHDVREDHPSPPALKRPHLDTATPRPFATLVQQGYPLDLAVTERDRWLTLADRVLWAVRGQPEHLDLPDHLETFINQGPDPARADAALIAWRNALITCGADASIAIPSASSADPLRQLIEALRLHHDALRSGMRGLFTRMPDSHAAGTGMFEMLRDEMLRHHERFVGREELLRDLSQRLLAPAPRPLCIMGSEGRGKSALLSALIWRLAKSQKLLGAVSVSAQQASPWLPACLLHFGKKSRDPALILRSLLEQANALLIQPVILPVRELSDLGMGAMLLHHERLVPSSRWQREDQLEALYATGAPQAAQRETSQVERLRGTLHAALVRLVEERGQALLVVDALDEISRDGTGLEFLPDVPAEVGVLFSTRPHQSILDVIERRFRPQWVELPGLSTDDIAVLTRVSDQSWIEQVREHTQGTPSLVHNIALQAQEHSDHTSVDIRAASQAVYEDQVRRWRMAGCAEANDPRYQVLRLLAVLEPVQPVPLSAVQGFLELRRLPCSQRELHTLLDAVSDQIEGLRANRVKLAAESLASHVRRKTLSDRDLRALLGQVADWLVEDTQVESAISAKFVATWTDERFNEDSDARSRVLGVVQTLSERSAGPRLFAMWRSGWSAKENTSPVAQACLRAAADLEHPRAMMVLGHGQLYGQGLEQAPAEAEIWLRKAAEHGDPIAMGMLGSHLLEGDRLPKNPEGGEHWLRKAAALEEPTAMAVLGSRLLDGDGLQADPAEGETWLRKAADLGDPLAMGILGSRLLDGDGLQADPAEGETRLRKAADLGDLQAMRALGSRLLDGDGLQADPAEGETWLRKAADLGDLQAMRALGVRLLDGDGLQADPAEGETWLRKAADLGDLPAMGVLGSRLLDGKGLQIDPAEGETWLRKAADLGDLPAMGVLGIRLLDGKGLQTDPAEGETWLRKAADLGDLQAMRALGVRLLDGKGLQADPAEGETWLRKAADLGDLQAMRILGSRLLDGKGLQADPAEGETWLRKATDLGDLQAMRILGSRLLDGKDLQADPAEGETWLRKAADLGDFQAMRILGSRLLDGKGLQADPAEGETWLRKAADLGDLQAMRVLGSRLLDGKGLQAHLMEGETWLRKAADLGDLVAMGILGVRLLDGKGLQAHPAEGETWLRKAADLGDLVAMGILGVRLLDGDGLQADPAEGETWLRKAADLGDLVVMGILGVRLLEGKGFQPDPAEGETWLRKAANLGGLQAMCILGGRLFDGDGLQADPAEGETWLRKAADLSDLVAMRALGVRLLDGNGLRLDPAEGETWLRKATGLGDLQAMGILGVRLLDGDGLRLDPAEGETWLRKATGLGDLQAMGILGVRLLDGNGIQADLAEGMTWLRKATDLGDLQAMRALGGRLLDGNGIPPDPTEGEIWLRKAAALGDLMAMGSLGERLLNGDSIQLDPFEGETWLRKTADLGGLAAMRILGDRLLDGDGLQADPVEGETWLRKAAELGDLFAMGILGSRLLDGDGIPPDPTEGEIWLRKAAAKHRRGTRQLLGLHLYHRARANLGAINARKEAGQLFLASLKEDPESSGVSLAYMIRRKEFLASEAPPVSQLLAPGLQTELDIALINKALVLAAGYGEHANWRRADGYMGRLRKASHVKTAISWWRQSAEFGDVEGELVLAWLARHGLIEMSDAEVSSRLARAAQGGWQVPHWLHERVSPVSSPKPVAEQARKARHRPASTRGRGRKK